MVPCPLGSLSHLPDRPTPSWCCASVVRSSWLVGSCSLCAPSGPTPASSCLSTSALLSLMGLSTNLYNHHNLYEEKYPNTPHPSIFSCSSCTGSIPTHLASQSPHELRYLNHKLQGNTNPSIMEQPPHHLPSPIHNPSTLHLLMPLGFF